MALIDRFLAKVSPEPNSGCWLWTGSQNGAGYGKIIVGNSLQLAHRVSYEMHIGKIPDQREIDHLCRIRCCVNPDHLEAVPHLENVRRGNGGKHKAKKTHCPHGHPYSGDNLIFMSNGGRACRECDRKRKRKSS